MRILALLFAAFFAVGPANAESLNSIPTRPPEDCLKDECLCFNQAGLKALGDGLLELEFCREQLKAERGFSKSKMDFKRSHPQPWWKNRWVIGVGSAVAAGLVVGASR